MTFLNNKPDPEVEFAEEIKAAEAELATKPEPVSEPEAEAPETETLENTLGVDKAEPVAAEKTPEAPAKPAEEETKVPLSALHQARREKQELERYNQEMQAYVQQMQAWAAQQQGQQQTEEQAIDWQQDPLGAMEQTRARQQRLEQYVAQWRQEQQERAYRENVTRVATNAVNEFKQATPDYGDAYKFAMESRIRELRVLFPNAAPEAVYEHVRGEEFALANSALQQRQNPGQVIYEFAKARGYTGPKPAEPAKPAPSKAVELLAEKAAVSTSLSTGGQSPRASVEISDSELVNLKGPDFDKAFERKFMPKRSGLFAR